MFTALPVTINWCGFRAGDKPLAFGRIFRDGFKVPQKAHLNATYSKSSCNAIPLWPQQPVQIMANRFDGPSLMIKSIIFSMTFCLRVSITGNGVFAGNCKGGTPAVAVGRLSIWGVPACWNPGRNPIGAGVLLLIVFKATACIGADGVPMRLIWLFGARTGVRCCNWLATAELFIWDALNAADESAMRGNYRPDDCCDPDQNSPRSWLAFSRIDLSPNVLSISRATLYVSLSMTFCRTCLFSLRNWISRQLFRSIFELKYQDTQYLSRIILQGRYTWRVSKSNKQYSFA